MCITCTILILLHTKTVSVFTICLVSFEKYNMIHEIGIPLQEIFNDAAFAKMKKGARLVNVARGGVIDDAALGRALDAKIVAQAALDVFNKEPPTDNPLVGETWILHSV